MSHAHAFNILLHITTDAKRPFDISDVLWARLGSTIKWIYGTISSDLLQTIFCCGDSTQAFWDKLKATFQDNKHIRVVYLESQFNALFRTFHRTGNN